MDNAKTIQDEQNELVKQSLKHNSRMLALEKAVIISNGNWNADTVLVDAEKIYQWLTKDL